MCVCVYSINNDQVTCCCIKCSLSDQMKLTCLDNSTGINSVTVGSALSLNSFHHLYISIKYIPNVYQVRRKDCSIKLLIGIIIARSSA